MRKRQSFLLTLIPAEDDQSSIHGKITTITNGRTSSFANLDELYELLKDELRDNPLVSDEIHSIFPLMSASPAPQLPE
jgi:hypothetical protein